MARTLTPKACYTLVNSIAHQLNGDSSLTATNLTDFVAVGEQILTNAHENILNAISIVGIKTIISNRPYKSKLALIREEDGDAFKTRIRKITYYERDAMNSGDYNTQSKTNFADGYDNGSNSGSSIPSMWEQRPRYALELNYCGQSVWQTEITIYQNQLYQAFSSLDEFNKFMSGYLQTLANEIESQKEAFARMSLLNFMGGVYDMQTYGTTAKDLVALYNADHGGTTFTGDDLRTGTEKEEFYKWFIALVKDDMTMLEYKSTANHWDKTLTVGSDTYHFYRHTPKANQKFLMYSKFINDLRTEVLPTIFNTGFLEENFEEVPFWQSQTSRSAISVTPSIPDVTGAGTGQTSGNAVALDYVVGMLFDEEALATQMIHQSTTNSPLEARKRYYNQFVSFNKNNINDFTQNAILYYMAS